MKKCINLEHRGKKSVNSVNRLILARTEAVTVVKPKFYLHSVS